MEFAVAVIFFLFTFVVSGLAVVAAWFILQPRGAQPTGDGPDLIRDEALSSISVWDNVLERFHFSDRIKAHLDQADLDTWTVGRLTSMMLLAFALAVVLLSSVEWIPEWLSPILAIGAAFLPYGYVLRRRAKRLERFEQQLPDALDLLARSLRAGHPFAVSMEFLARDNHPPISTEFRAAADEHRLGGSWEESLNHLAERVPLVNVRLFVAAVIIQSRTGGKLSEVLSQLAETIRESQALKGEVKALSAHARVTGSVLTILPIVIAALMTMFSPGYLDVLIAHPIGRVLVIVSLLSLVAAHFVIRKIIDIRL